MSRLGKLQYLPKAREAIARERRYLDAERDSFLAFHDQIRSLRPASLATSGESSTRQTQSMILSDPDADSVSLDSICDAYRESVMSVDHFEEEYDESLQRHMAAELSVEIAQAVTSQQTLTPLLKQSLIRASQTAVVRRDDLLTELSAEADSLNEAETKLSRFADATLAVPEPPISGSFDTLATIWRDMRAMEREYDQYCRERQAHIRDRRVRVGTPDGVGFCGYVYEDLNVTYPVLMEIVTQLRKLRTRRRCVLSLLFRLD